LDPVLVRRIDQLFNSSEKRLARALLLLANFGKDGRREPVIAKVSQETLADMIGTTRSRVSQLMNKFRQLGYIEYNGEISRFTPHRWMLFCTKSPNKNSRLSNLTTNAPLMTS
jgi:DNA-binding IclR family transcriptional regulator